MNPYTNTWGNIVNDHSLQDEMLSEPEEMVFDASESENASALGWLIETEMFDANN